MGVALSRVKYASEGARRPAVASKPSMPLIVLTWRVLSPLDSGGRAGLNDLEQAPADPTSPAFQVFAFVESMLNTPFRRRKGGILNRWRKLHPIC